MSDAPICYLDAEGVANYRASALHGCEKALLLSRMGYEALPPPAWLQERFDAGHENEPLILNKLQEKFLVDYFGLQETLHYDIGTIARINGHVDALGTANSEGRIRVTHVNRDPYALDFFTPPTVPFIVEAKALSDASFKSWASSGFKAFQYYAWQVSLYMQILDLPLVMAIKNKNTNELRVEWWDQPMVPMSEMVAKVLRVEAMAAANEIPEQCSYKMFPCGWWYLHEEDEQPRVVDGNLTTNLDDVKAMGEVYLAARDAEKAAKEQKERAGAKLKELFNNEPAKAVLSNMSVSTFTSPRESFKWREFMADNPGLDYAKWLTKSESLYVRVTPKEEKNGE